MVSMTVIVIALSLLSIVLGVILGVVRGGNRSITRLVLVILSAVIALLLCDGVADKLLTMEIDGSTIKDSITSALGESLSSVSDVIIPVLTICIKIVAFILFFIVFQFLTWIIVFQICKAFVKIGENKKKFLGGLFGFFQGVIVAFCICTPLTYLSLSLGQFEEANVTIDTVTALISDTGEGEANTSGIESSSIFTTMKDLELASYNKTFMSKIFNVATPVFNKVFTAQAGDKTTITLKGQVEASIIAVEFAEEIKAINAIDLNGDIQLETVDQIVAILEKIDVIKENNTEEAISTVSKIVKALATKIPALEGVNIDFTTLDVGETNFTYEAQILRAVYEYKENGTGDTTDIINKLGESALIFDYLYKSSVVLEVNNKDDVENAIYESNLSQEKKGMMLQLFGLVD